MKKLLREDVKYIVVHCAATRPSMNWGAEDIDRLHRNFGWSAIGYHWVIRRDGQLEMGRPLNVPGAHASRQNHHSIGICMVGGVNEDDVTIAENNFTVQQFATLHRLLDSMEDMFPTSETLGHRDLPNVHKACPSFDVRSWRLREGGHQVQNHHDRLEEPNDVELEGAENSDSDDAGAVRSRLAGPER